MGIPADIWQLRSYIQVDLVVNNVQRVYSLTTLLEGLITPVLAVSLLVAHFVDIYAFSTPALEFARSRALNN